MAGGWDLRDPLKLSGFKAGAPVPLATEDKEWDLSWEPQSPGRKQQEIQMWDNMWHQDRLRMCGGERKKMEPNLWTKAEKEQILAPVR